MATPTITSDKWIIRNTKTIIVWIVIAILVISLLYNLEWNIDLSISNLSSKWLIANSNKFIIWTIIILVLISLIYLVILRIIYRDLKYSAEHPYLFTLETRWELATEPVENASWFL
jgi:hypothetical protein